MTDQPVKLVFEDPPKRAQRSIYHPLLLALKDTPTNPDSDGRHVTRYARVSNPQGMADLDEREANTIASSMRTAAKAIPGDFEIISRSIPGTGKHGVWARYVHPEPLVAAHAEAAALIKAAQQEGRVAPADGIIKVASTEAEIVGDGTGQALPPADDDLDPIGEDDAWEFPAGEIPARVTS